jgi:hypothetical protein
MRAATRGTSEKNNIRSKERDRPERVSTSWTCGAKHQDKVSQRTTAHDAEQYHQAGNSQDRAQIVQPIPRKNDESDATYDWNEAPDHHQLQSSPSQVVVDAVDLWHGAPLVASFHRLVQTTVSRHMQAISGVDPLQSVTTVSNREGKKRRLS